MEFRKVIRNEVEYRFDPITHDQCRINPSRTTRVKQAESDLWLSEIVDRTKGTCPFYPEKVKENTPKFPQEECIPATRVHLRDYMTHGSSIPCQK